MMIIIQRWLFASSSGSGEDHPLGGELRIEWEVKYHTFHVIGE